MSLNVSGASDIDLFGRALAAHRAGDLEQADEAYRQLLAAKPEHADALHLRGVIAHQLGRNDEAIERIGRAIALDGGQPHYHSNLGVALRSLGRLADAEASFRAALRLDRGFVDAHNNLGIVLRDLGRPEEAEATLRTALHLKPDFPDAHNNLGNALLDLGDLAAAAARYRAALRLRPNLADAHHSLGSVLKALGRPAEAAASFRAALRLRPDFADSHNELGSTLSALGCPAEAEASFREALRLWPDFPDAHNNLGNALLDLGRLAEAEASHREALRLRPNYPVAHSNLGVALRYLGRPAEAAASYREALRLRPNFADARANLGLALLMAGRFEEGWREYEFRWQAKHMAGSARSFSVPQWGGEPIGDRVILLHAEQGLGDTLQFCRYVPLVSAAAKVVLEVQPPLLRLLSGLPGPTAILARGERLPPFDLHCPLMSLPRAFGTTLQSIPAAIPYLAADPARVAAWQARLAGLDGLRVGLVWAGGARLEWPEIAAVDRRRSIALATLAPLAEVSGVRFVSLQKGAAAAQAAHPPRGMALYDVADELDDFTDTAALIACLDLVISVDTSVAHLAGALGKPVWLLNRFDTCWRWLLARDDSPWYPHLRQFRQPSPGDWASVVLAVRDALQRLTDPA